MAVISLESLGDWRRTRYAGEIVEADFGTEQTVAGWLHSTRVMGKVAFVHIRDRTGLVQATALKQQLGDERFKELTELSRESVVILKGTVQKNPQAKSGYELLPSAWKVLSRAETPLPLGVADKVSAEMETRLDNRFLDLRKPEMAAIFKIRSTLIFAMERHLKENGFLQVHTPKIVASATEGGTALFSMQYFEKKAYLNQSPQLYKQTLQGAGFDRVFEVGPAFRAEEHDTVRHINEFISIDIEMSFADEEDVMRVLEGVVSAGLDAVRAENARDLDTLGITIPEQKPPFPRYTYTQVIEELAKKGITVNWGDDLSMEVTKAFAGDRSEFYFITRWPTAAKPFYAQPVEGDEKVSRTFDLMFSEKEITSGAQRVWDPSLLCRQLEERGLDPAAFESYIKVFRFGCPPHAGWGLGAERLLMILTRRDNVRDCVLFPRDRYRITP